MPLASLAHTVYLHEAGSYVATCLLPDCRSSKNTVTDYVFGNWENLDANDNLRGIAATPFSADAHTQYALVISQASLRGRLLTCLFMKQQSQNNFIWDCMVHLISDAFSTTLQTVSIHTHITVSENENCCLSKCGNCAILSQSYALRLPAHNLLSCQIWIALLLAKQFFICYPQSRAVTVIIEYRDRVTSCVTRLPSLIRALLIFQRQVENNTPAFVYKSNVPLAKLSGGDVY